MESDDTMSKITSCLPELLASRSYDRIPTDDVADSLKLSKQMSYHHFSNLLDDLTNRTCTLAKHMTSHGPETDFGGDRR